jgi:hypothetical protein
LRDKGAAGLTKPLSTDPVDKLAGRFTSGQRSFRRSEEHVNRYAQGAGQPLDVVERDVPDLPLDMSDEGPVQAGLEGEFFL